MKKIFSGLGTALVTPFNNGEVDYYSLKVLLNKQIEAGVEAVVVLGTTGEPSTLTDKERDKIIKTTVSLCKGQTKVIVGVGSNSTKKAVSYYKRAEELGVDGALIVTPYYNKCTQDGIFEHYSAIANSGKLPIIVYNVPSRTGVNIDPETLQRLAEIENICGIKESSGNINQALHYFYVVDKKMAIYCGEDALMYVFATLGAEGGISVVSNLLPKETKKILDSCRNGKYEKSRELQRKILPLIDSIFARVNPIPIKSALSYLGLCKNELRLPLTPLPENDFLNLKKEIDKVWSKIDDSL